MKHRFVKDFHRGLELYGQNGAARLQEPHVRESLASIGLVVAEGPNDVIKLDTLGVAARQDQNGFVDRRWPSDQLHRSGGTSGGDGLVGK